MSNYIQWFAIRKSDNAVIAESDSYLQCSNAAVRASGWDKSPGTVAPYFMTNATWFGSSLHSDAMISKNFSYYSAAPVRLKAGYAGEPVFHISSLCPAAAVSLALTVAAVLFGDCDA